MNVTTAMELLTRADPCGHAMAGSPKPGHQRHKNPVKRTLAVGMASILFGIGGVVAAQATITARQPAALTTWEHQSLTTLSASPQDYTNVHGPEISTMINDMISVYPLPPGATRDKVFAPLLDSFPMAHGTLLPVSPDDRRAQPYIFGISQKPVELDRTREPQEMSVIGLSGTVALLAVNSWYEYWLSATPAQRRAAQPVLDSFQTWPDLAYRLGATDIATTGRIASVARNAEAAANGNSAPIRTWLTEQQWIDPTLL